MVTLEDDIAATRRAFDEACLALGARRRPAFGAMIETPAAALALPAIARHVDFLSVGTNDLTQYTFAAGRDEPNVNQYFQDTHGRSCGCSRSSSATPAPWPLTLCGELAGRRGGAAAAPGDRLPLVQRRAAPHPGHEDRIRSLRVDAAGANDDRRSAHTEQGEWSRGFPCDTLRMSACWSCGRPIDESDHYCRHCG